MNRACQKCGNIMAFPDVPLPHGHRVPCEACGFENLAADDDPGITADSISFSGLTNLTDTESSFTIPPDINLRRGQPAKTGAAASPTRTKTAKPKHRPPAAQPPIALGAASNMAQNQNASNISMAELKSSLYKEFDQRLSQLEARFDARLALLGAGNAGNAGSDGFSANPAADLFTGLDFETKERILEKEVLVCTQSATLIQTAEKQLDSLDFSIHPITKLASACQAIINKKYHIIILEQKFLRGEDGKNILSHLKKTHLPTRRCQIAVLITPNIATCESQVFFQWGIDLNIHPRDLDNLGTYLNDLMRLRKKMLDPYLSYAKPI